MTQDQKFFCLPCPLSLSISTPGLCQQLQRGLRGKRREEKKKIDRPCSGRNKDRYGYRLPPNVFCSLILSTGIIRSPKPLSWPYIACLEISWQLTGGSGASIFKRELPGPVHRLCRHAHMYTESSSEALWHAFGNTVVVLSEKRAGKVISVWSNFSCQGSVKTGTMQR